MRRTSSRPCSACRPDHQALGPRRREHVDAPKPTERELSTFTLVDRTKTGIVDVRDRGGRGNGGTALSIGSVRRPGSNLLRVAALRPGLEMSPPSDLVRASPWRYPVRIPA